MNPFEDILIITAEEENVRLDKVLAERFREVYSRSYFQFLIKEHSVLLNGSPVKKQVKPQEGDEVQIQFILTPEIQVEPENIPINIIYEDDSIIVVNKEAGLVVHPAPGNWKGTFVNALLYHCKEIEKEGSLRPGIVHRLDKDTSGLLVAAKTLLAHQRLIEMFSAREVGKEYLALCVGNPGSKVIDEPIGRHPIDRKKMAVIAEGRNARTECRTLAHHDNISLVLLKPETGRTHQIRVHLKHVNAPVLGDEVYGNAGINTRYAAKRQMLHAYKLRFSHPDTGAIMEFKADLPQDMLQLMTRAKLKCDY